MSTKVLCYLIFTLFVLSIFLSCTIIGKCNESNVNVIYVDDDGNAKYKSIQNAIDNASTNDEIYVYNGTYFENIFLNKSITLTGENKDNTIIDANFSGNVVDLIADRVNLSGFTIKNSGTNIDQSGLYIQSNFSLIYDNNINNNKIGIRLIQCYNNTIYHNNFLNNTKNAIDDSNNTWYNKTIMEGNYWDDYIGNDNNYDGIGDIPYNISKGNNYDIYPIMSPLSKKSTDNFHVDEEIVINMLFIGMFFVIIFVLPIAYYWRKRYLK